MKKNQILLEEKATLEAQAQYFKQVKDEIQKDMDLLMRTDTANKPLFPTLSCSPSCAPTSPFILSPSPMANSLRTTIASPTHSSIHSRTNSTLSRLMLIAVDDCKSPIARSPAGKIASRDSFSKAVYLAAPDSSILHSPTMLRTPLRTPNQTLTDALGQRLQEQEIAVEILNEVKICIVKVLILVS